MAQRESFIVRYFYEIALLLALAGGSVIGWGACLLYGRGM